MNDVTGQTDALSAYSGTPGKMKYGKQYWSNVSTPILQANTDLHRRLAHLICPRIHVPPFLQQSVD